MSLHDDLKMIRTWIDANPDVPESVGFLYHGTRIVNPFYDETMRFEVDPVAYYGEENIRKFIDDVAKQRMSFSLFKEQVRARGGIWASNDVQFTQFWDGYGASYKPNFPERSSMDCALSYNWLSNKWSFITPEQYQREYDNVGKKKEPLDERIAEADAQKTKDVIFKDNNTREAERE